MLRRAPANDLRPHAGPRGPPHGDPLHGSEGTGTGRGWVRVRTRARAKVGWGSEGTKAARTPGHHIKGVSIRE